MSWIGGVHKSWSILRPAAQIPQQPVKRTSDSRSTRRQSCKSSVSLIIKPKLHTYAFMLKLDNAIPRLKERSLHESVSYEISLSFYFDRKEICNGVGVGTRSLVRNVFDPGI